MTDRMKEVTEYLDTLKGKIKDLNVEVTVWKVAAEGTEAGSTLEVSIKLLIPKKAKV
jgi:hypothetical protein